MSKTFTLDEAQVLLPVLGSLLTRAREAANLASQQDAEMQELSQRIFLSGGLHVDVPAAARRRAERDKAVAETRSSLQEIEEIGAQVADGESGGLEFPSTLEGRAILLCWKLGEDSITQWRETADDGDVRRDVDARFGRRDGNRLN